MKVFHNHCPLLGSHPLQSCPSQNCVHWNRIPVSVVLKTVLVQAVCYARLSFGYLQQKRPCQPIPMFDHHHGGGIIFFLCLPFWNFPCSNLLLASCLITMNLLESLDLSTSYLLLDSQDINTIPTMLDFFLRMSKLGSLGVSFHATSSSSLTTVVSWTQPSMSKNF